MRKSKKTIFKTEERNDAWTIEWTLFPLSSEHPEKGQMKRISVNPFSSTYALFVNRSVISFFLLFYMIFYFYALEISIDCKLESKKKDNRRCSHSHF